jgi:hypothetical protein
MHRSARTLAAPLLAVALLGAGTAPAAAAQFRFDFDDENIELDDEDVVITADDGTRARISPSGSLSIRGRRVELDEVSRRALRNYNEGIHFIVDQAVEIGLDSAGLAFTAMGEALAAIASGNGERAERRVERRAEPIKEKARALCSEVRALVLVQESIVSRVRAFRPYAVLDEDAGDDCEVDD